ncbi:MAG: hypothetical protein H7A35_14235 [Planctomycetales bacterium]|nr:hypothetical protein [bacterium]UNM07995.1 MAG: hypothetical protein H7A35_14235 [Planctomycetales bacterium]
MLADKPWYDYEALRHITLGELKTRQWMITNEQARVIAQRLWKITEDSWNRGRRRRIWNNPNDEWTAMRFVSGASGSLPHSINELRGVDFGDLIVEGPDRLRECIARMNPLMQLFKGRPRLRNTEDCADFIVHYLEFIRYPGTSLTMPFILEAIWWIAVLGFVPFWFWLQGSAGRGQVSNEVIIMAIAAVAGASLLTAHNNGRARVRAMAVYISFTDEFIESDAPMDGNLPQGPGW